jgi:glycosyltransferase involved in cell wall biosynthesis
LKNAALRKGLRDKIDFPGYITNEMLPTYMSAADVFVLPSKSDRGEAFGIVLLEAMSCGTPVVAADIPGVADVPENGGVTYDVGSVEGLHDALQRALHENFTPRRTVREYYTTAQMCSQVIDIYDSVIQG